MTTKGYNGFRIITETKANERNCNEDRERDAQAACCAPGGTTQQVDFEHNHSNCNDVQQERKADDNPTIITIKHKPHFYNPLIYKLTDTPPLYSIVFFALQQGVLCITAPLMTVFLVSEVVCAGDDDEIKTQLMSATFFMIGLSTFAMVTIGVRLPVFQGPNFTYILPILSLLKLEEYKCPVMFELTNPSTNITTLMTQVNNGTVMIRKDYVYGRINELSGSLMLVGTAHFLIGATGLVGAMAKFIGPITIVPVVFLFGLQIHPVVVNFSQTHWGTALLTASIAIILGLYLSKYKTPIPVWTPSRGLFISWLPIHNVFSIFISIVVGWLVCFVLTKFDVLSNDPTTKEYFSRTDARFDVVHNSDWFLFPYPGQFGTPSFKPTAVITFFIATLISVLDSIGDYSAIAQIACAPRPPSFAFNRGVAVEGLMVIISGAFGCGHGTVSFSENIGAMKISRVASKSVFQVCGLIYIVFAFIGKFGAFFITIPHSVIGGSQVVTFGILIGVILSYLQYIDLKSTRNQSILGMSLLLGFMMPYWSNSNPDAIDTGDVTGSSVIKVILTNSSCVGGLVACFLDNTIPGTRDERGITSQLQELNAGELNDDDQDVECDTGTLLHGKEVYRLPWLPERIRRSAFAKCVPIFDTTTSVIDNTYN